ncbi:hypothetical protein ACJIZ3_016187 [Penstemon smallii]|uniref:Uncharacterized protein n=1 Tax=Penstemon smallii TaxID=265156 RepID=A0ABD3RQF8_9LAMI
MYRSGAVMAWNVFKFCTALRGLGSIMILLVLAVVGVSYYAVVITNYGPGLAAGGFDSLIAFLVLILFHCLLVMLLWSYFSVVFTDPGGVPCNWRPAVDEERGDTDPLTATEFPADPENSRIRFCRKCNQLKPPRCHHCSFYTFLETSLVTLSLLPQFIAFFSDGEIPGSPGTLATTFLAYEKKTTPKWRYDLGRKRNFEQFRAPMRREVRGNSNQSGGPFDSFGGFGSQRSMFPSLFGGKDPFDDPFFTRPFGSFSGSSMPSTDTDAPGNSHNTSKLKGPLIEELDSDDERMSEENEDDSNSNPLVEHPEDQHNDHGKSNSDEKRLTTYSPDHNKVKGTQPQTKSVSFRRVTCGGVNGTYYTATTTRRTGGNGVTLEESKQADKTTGQATHRISRGIHDKGHSVMRKLDSDGKVDTMQTLHNLNEGASGGRHNHRWGGFGDHFIQHFGRNIDDNFQAQSSTGRPKKTIRINIE